MSSKSKKLYACIECGYETSKWMGRCVRCGKWGTLKELEKEKLNRKGKKVKNLKVEKLSNKKIKGSSLKRLSTDFAELNRVLGGGFVRGEVILLGGEPGVGKTTLLLQVLDGLSKKGNKCIYVSAEESLDQLSTHSIRLKLDNKSGVICDSDIDSILATLSGKKLDLVVIDSIQTVKTEDMQGIRGGVGQVKECASRIVHFAKEKNITVILIGHITKGGNIAGPKVIEHLVDAILYLEGDSALDIRFIKSLKNRFASTRDVGVFKFERSGFKDLANTSEAFLESHEPRVGVCKGVIYEGRRAILIEVQALTTESAFSAPQRVVKGIGKAKIQMLCALLTKYTKANFLNRDVYINLANGLKVKDDSLDLSIVLALLSSYFDKEVDPYRVAIGEISLTGMIYSTDLIKNKVKVVSDLGYKEIIIPSKAKSIVKSSKREVKYINDIKEIDRIL